ncbi:MAG: methyltransferase domain-containing protein [Chloroflexia bacterium]|nr:methyltransferase domain-containing protein [Chloroflexia bacterium]
MIRAKIDNGTFHDASDVVSEALRLMEERDRLDRLRAAMAFDIGARMSEANVQRRTTEFYDQRPDDDPEYYLTIEQRAVWTDDLAGMLRRYVRPVEAGTSARVLDVGTGRGAFAVLLAELGYNVVGIDGSESAISKGRLLLADEDPLVAESVSLQLVDWTEPTIRLPDNQEPGGYFDAIVSKQAACHIYDPIATFKLWASWLRRGGALIVVDGLWQRSGWTDRRIVDELPLATVGGLGTISYLVEQGGFRVQHRRLLARVNRDPATRGGSGPIYVLVATKRA